jgi:hypothetical protein
MDETPDQPDFGPAFTLEELSEMLEVTPDEVTAMAERGELMGVPTKRGLVFPYSHFQLTGGGWETIPGLRSVIKVFNDAAADAKSRATIYYGVAAAWLEKPNARFGDQAPLTVLRRDTESIRRAAAKVAAEITKRLSR